ncbi:hypothetical protein ACWGAN_01625 [Streptomyces sp. NPDC054945]
MKSLGAKTAWRHPATVLGYKRLAVRRTIWLASLGTPFAFAAGCLMLGRLRPAAAVLLLITLGSVPWLPWVAIAYSRRHRVKAVLRAYPWQEWPCLHPRYVTGRPATITILFQENFTAMFRTIPFPVSRETLEDDHPDRIWFAGDPRFGGVVSPVGGHYPVRVVPHTPRREECGGEGFALARRVGLVRASGKATRT